MAANFSFFYLLTHLPINTHPFYEVTSRQGPYAVTMGQNDMVSRRIAHTKEFCANSTEKKRFPLLIATHYNMFYYEEGMRMGNMAG